MNDNINLGRLTAGVVAFKASHITSALSAIERGLDHEDAVAELAVARMALDSIRALARGLDKNIAALEETLTPSA